MKYLQKKITLIGLSEPCKAADHSADYLAVDEEKIDLELVDITGRILYSIRQVSVHRAHTINVSRFRAGMYLLRVRGTANYIHTTRIVKK